MKIKRLNNIRKKLKDIIINLSLSNKKYYHCSDFPIYKFDKNKSELVFCDVEEFDSIRRLKFNLHKYLYEIELTDNNFLKIGDIDNGELVIDNDRDGEIIEKLLEMNTPDELKKLSKLYLNGYSGFLFPEWDTEYKDEFNWAIAVKTELIKSIKLIKEN